MDSEVIVYYFKGKKTEIILPARRLDGMRPNTLIIPVEERGGFSRVELCWDGIERDQGRRVFR